MVKLKRDLKYRGYVFFEKEKELSELLDNSSNIKFNIDRYMERPSATFCKGEYIIWDDFSYAEFLAYHTLENKPSKTREYLPDELDENLIENNHKERSCLQKFKLMIARETMRFRKVRRILRNHELNKLLSLERLPRHVILFSVQRWKGIALRLSTIISK